MEAAISDVLGQPVLHRNGNRSDSAFWMKAEFTAGGREKREGEEHRAPPFLVPVPVVPDSAIAYGFLFQKTKQNKTHPCMLFHFDLLKNKIPFYIRYRLIIIIS